MRLFVDAQLPARVADHPTATGHDAQHVKHLPGGSFARDATIAAHADQDGRIVMTKDVDFADSHFLRGSSRRLLRITTGTIRNSDLIALIDRHLEVMVRAFATADHVELSTNGLVVHERPRS